MENKRTNLSGNFFFSTEPMPNPEPVGCFWDYFDRALPDHYANFRDQIIWKNMNLTVNQCARVAQDKGYEYFAVQFYGECYGGKNAENTTDTAKVPIAGRLTSKTVLGWEEAWQTSFIG